MAKSFPTPLFHPLLKGILFLFMGGIVSGCWLTDRSEEEKKKIGPHLINNDQSASGNGKGEKPKIEFKTKSYDFGTISQGETVKHSFIYRNAGEAALIIASIEPGCGCTVTEDAPEEPLLPGESDTLTVTYDSKGHQGIQNRTVSIVANTAPKTTTIRMKGEVRGPK